MSISAFGPQLFCGAYDPDLTVGAITCRRFAPLKSTIGIAKLGSAWGARPTVESLRRRFGGGVRKLRSALTSSQVRRTVMK